jgi:hypothetical protein
MTLDESLTPSQWNHITLEYYKPIPTRRCRPRRMSRSNCSYLRAPAESGFFHRTVPLHVSDLSIFIYDRHPPVARRLMYVGV